jgi:hypothetical protein
MQIRVSVNPHAVAAADIQAQLDAGLHALERPEIRVRADRQQTGAEAFGLAEAYQFIVDCGPGITALVPLVTAILQLSNTIVQRRALGELKKKAKRKARRTARTAAASESAPAVVVNVNGRQLELPANDRELEEFVNAVSRPPEARPEH